jgi:hypothetical protein
VGDALMAHAPETRAAVRAGYIYQRLTVEQAAERQGVSIATARRWKAQDAVGGDDWDSARTASSMATQSTRTMVDMVLADFLTNYQATMEAVRGEQMAALEKAEAMSRLADAFTKTMAAVAKASPELARYSVATEILQELAAFVREHHPDRIEVVLELLEPFAQHIARIYG